MYEEHLMEDGWNMYLGNRQGTLGHFYYKRNGWLINEDGILRPGENVERIEDGEFRDCEYIFGVDISGSHIKSIGTEAFCVCKNLKVFKASNCTELTEIGNNAISYSPVKKISFDGCSNLQNIGASFAWNEELEKLSFRGCENLAGLAEGMLLSCRSIKELDFMDCRSLNFLEDNALLGCSAKKILLPDSVEYIGENALEGCRNLETVRLPANFLDGADIAIYNAAMIVDKMINIFGETANRMMSHTRIFVGEDDLSPITQRIRINSNDINAELGQSERRPRRMAPENAANNLYRNESDTSIS